MIRRRVAMLVPAMNEEGVIGQTIRSLMTLVPSADIYVVDDGSVDNTAGVAQQLTPNVLALNRNRGKAKAMNLAIKHFQLAERYEYLMPMDADTAVTKEFLDATLPVLDADNDRDIACVVGKVIGRPHNWVTSYRVWEYEVAQTIHKAAQSITRSIIVTPGCATVYRAELFRSLRVPVGTLAEDMDLTYLIHRRRLGRIVFIPGAVVVTQDPKTLRELVRQLDRWYTGFWQCVMKHNLPWGGQMLDLEVAMLAIEGLFNGLLVFTLPFMIAFAMLKQPSILLVPLVFDLVVFMLPTIALSIRRHGAWRLLRYIPMLYVARFVSCLIFLRSYLKVVVGFDLGMKWFKATRYSIQEQPWRSQATQ